MSKEGETSQNPPIDAKFIMNTLICELNRKFQQLRNDLQEDIDRKMTPTQTRVSRNLVYEEKHDDESDYAEVISRRGKRVQNNHDANLGSIKIKILPF